MSRLTALTCFSTQLFNRANGLLENPAAQHFPPQSSRIESKKRQPNFRYSTTWLAVLPHQKMGGIDFAYPAHLTKLTLRMLWRQLADPRRPVGERRAYTWRAGRTSRHRETERAPCARTEQV